MATKTTSDVPTGMEQSMTKLAVISNAVSAAHRNVRNGPTTVDMITIDNTVSASNAAMWAKVYNEVDDAFVAGTSKPVLVLPVETVSVGPLVAGYPVVVISGGLPFSNGVSVLASKEGGDTMTGAPDSNVDMYLVTRD